jgi:tetratricopeptide (TPR) repeat protein
MTRDLPAPLKQALAAYQSGNLAEAKSLCDAIMGATLDRGEASYFNALTLLAAIQSRSGQLAEALASYDQAIALRPDFAEVHNNRADVLKALKRLDEALAGFDRAIALRADFAEALNNRGNTLLELKRFDEALASYDRALAVRPDYANSLNNRGSALIVLERFDEALASYDRALAIQPDFAAARQNRDLAAKRRELAAAARKTLQAPADGAIDDAATDSGSAVPSKPSSPGPPTPRPDDDAAAPQLPNVNTMVRHARTLMHLNRFADALASYDQAIASRPDHTEAFNERGVALMELRRFPDALASFAKAQELQPDYAEAHWNEARLHLLNGDFRFGWLKYPWLWKRGTSQRRRFPQPPWDGLDSLYNKTILLHGNHVHSDAIRFSRYVPLVAARGARVILEVDKALRELMIGPAGAPEIIADGAPSPPFDIHCALAGLPLAFGTRIDTIPPALPLRASMGEATSWETRLGARHRCRIGIAWAGDPDQEGDHARSTDLRSFLPLLDVNATFVSVQKELRPGDQAVLKEHNEILHFGDALSDFSETAALLSCLDLVICSDTTVAHLAGAMRIPVWVLLPFTPDWFWLLDRADSPWYPTARLFRQSRHDDWREVVVRVAGELRPFVDHTNAACPR